MILFFLCDEGPALRYIGYMMDWRKSAEYLQILFICLPTNDSSRYRCKSWSDDRPGPSASTQPESSSESLGYSADCAAASLLPFSANAEVNISSTVTANF